MYPLKSHFRCPGPIPASRARRELHFGPGFVQIDLLEVEFWSFPVFSVIFLMVFGRFEALNPVFGPREPSRSIDLETSFLLMVSRFSQRLHDVQLCQNPPRPLDLGRVDVSSCIQPYNFRSQRGGEPSPSPPCRPRLGDSLAGRSKLIPPRSLLKYRFSQKIENPIILNQFLFGAKLWNLALMRNLGLEASLQLQPDMQLDIQPDIQTTL